jgi:hypothetical protein
MQRKAELRVKVHKAKTHPAALDAFGAHAREHTLEMYEKNVTDRDRSGEYIANMYVYSAAKGCRFNAHIVSVPALTASEQHVRTAQQTLFADGGVLDEGKAVFAVLAQAAGKWLCVQVACKGGFKQWRARLAGIGGAVVDPSKAWETSVRRLPLDLRGKETTFHSHTFSLACTHSRTCTHTRATHF